MIGISSISEFDPNRHLQELHKHLQERHKIFPQSTQRLEEDRRDLERVRNELRQEQHDQQRQWARLHQLILKDEINRSRKSFEAILYISLRHRNTELRSVLKEMDSDIKRWKDLVDSTPLETQREMKVIEMQVKFIKAIGQFAKWNLAIKNGLKKAQKGSRDTDEKKEIWSIIHDKWENLLVTLLNLQPNLVSKFYDLQSLISVCFF